jgi:hypothetical protein
MPAKKRQLICPKCRHVYESLRRTGASALCPACAYKPRMVVDVSEFDPYILCLLAGAGVIMRTRFGMI